MYINIKIDEGRRTLACSFLDDLQPGLSPIEFGMASNNTPAPGTSLLTIQQVAKRFGVAARTIWRWEAQGRIPRAVRVTPATVRWRAEQIDKHVAALDS
jgi:prophage regulatory protein